jgi:hypothetical protein
MTNANPILSAAVKTFVSAIELTIENRNDGAIIKGATLAAAHGLFDTADHAAMLTIADNLPKYKKGGDKVANAASKLCNRYYQVAAFLQSNGLSFDVIGTALDDVRKVSINLVETIKKAEKDNDHAHHAAALQWSADKSFIGYLNNAAAIDEDNNKAEFQRMVSASKAEAKLELEKMATELATLRAQVATMASKAKAAQAKKKAAA